MVTKPTTRVRSRVGVNSSASGTAITATPATPAPTTKPQSAMYHQPPSGASASAPVASENIRMPAISGRRRPRRSPARPQTMLPPIAPTPGAQQHRRRLPERQVPLVGQVGDDEGDQEEVEQVEHGADHHRARQQVEAPRQRRLVERLQHRGAERRSGSLPRRAARIAREQRREHRRAAGGQHERADQLDPEAGGRLRLADLQVRS